MRPGNHTIDESRQGEALQSSAVGERVWWDARRFGRERVGEPDGCVSASSARVRFTEGRLLSVIHVFCPVFLIRSSWSDRCD